MVGAGRAEDGALPRPGGDESGGAEKIEESGGGRWRNKTREGGDTWAPRVGCWDGEEIWRKMSVGGVDMKERILLTVTEYSVLKEKMKEHECGWSQW
jgi:hypothetical protein